METPSRPNAHILDLSNTLANCRPIVSRDWRIVNGKVHLITVVRDGRPGVGAYEAIIVNETQYCQTWGKNARTLLAAAKRRAGTL
jgi:hypothetical protein